MNTFHIPFSTSLRPAAAMALALTILLPACSGGGGGGGQPPVQAPIVSATGSQLTADPAVGVLADGQTTSKIEVVVRDTNNQPVGGKAVRLIVSGSGNALTPSSLLTDGSGKASAALSSTVAELKQVRAVVDPGTSSEVSVAQEVQITFVPAGSATLVQPARFEDRNRSGTADLGDAIVLRFGVPVAVIASRPEDFEAPVNGDTFGVGATVQTGAAPEEVELILGDNPVLRTRGSFDPAAVGTNDPSGIAVASGASGVVTAASGTALTASAAQDIVPALVPLADITAADARRSAFGDLDTDSDLDAVVATGSSIEVLIRDASGALIPTLTLPNPGTRAVAVGDLNRLGGDDFVTTRDGFVQLWLNNTLAGTALSASLEQELPAGNGNAVVLADIDGDGFRDVAVGSDDGVRVFRNGRNLGVTLTLLQTVSGVTDVRDLLAGDFDGDGDIDLIAGTGGGLQLLRNDGGGNLVAELLDGAAVDSVAVGDVDGDGLMDLAVTDGQGARLLRNDGQGGFDSSSLPGSAEEVALADLDQDARTDLIVRTSAGVSVFRSTAGGFASVQELAVIDPRSLAIADVDRDGDFDLAVVRADGVAILAGSLRGTFGRTELTSGDAQPPASSTAVAAGDIDGDGRPDLVVAREGVDVVLINQGDGTFTYSGRPEHTLGDGLASAVALGDLDGDGLLDAVIVERFDANRPARWRAWFNNGSGGFDTASREIPHQASEDARAVALGDLTGDGRANPVVGADGENKVFFLANVGGNPTFFQFANVFNPATNNRDTRALVLYDIDGEGDLDLVVGNRGSGEGNQVYRLSLIGGEPSYSEFPLLANEQTIAAAVADFDGDGLIDVVFANEDDGGVNQHRIHTFGRRGVQAVGQSIRFSSGSPATSLATADVDGDGMLDLIMGTADGFVQVWTQQAPLTFAVTQQLALPRVTALTNGDFDRDGDQDVFAATDVADIVLLNR